MFVYTNRSGSDMSKSEQLSSADEDGDDEDAVTVYECPGLAPVYTPLSLLDSVSAFQKLSK